MHCKAMPKLKDHPGYPWPDETLDPPVEGGPIARLYNINDPNEVRRWLKAVCRTVGKPPTRLAEAAGMHQSTINRFLKGHPAVKVLKQDTLKAFFEAALFAHKATQDQDGVQANDPPEFYQPGASLSIPSIERAINLAIAKASVDFGAAPTADEMLTIAFALREVVSNRPPPFGAETWTLSDLYSIVAGMILRGQRELS